MSVLLGIDAGKTNLRIGVFHQSLEPLERWSVPANDMEAALKALRARLRLLAARYSVTAAGVSTFGPLCTDQASARYGEIFESSDPAWSGVNLPALASEALGRAIAFDYDVNAGAIAEQAIGAARQSRNFVYLSVGTGIGAAAVRGNVAAGYAPQLGHVSLPREPDDSNFAGSCRFHGGCLQGLASGRAVTERWGAHPQDLAWNHPAWNLEARYLARACANLIYTFSPERIVIGSSLGLVEMLIERINEHLLGLLNGFLEPELRALYRTQPPVVRAGMTPDSSLVGAALMARDGLGLRFGQPTLRA